jgi:hypothetical protein
MERHPRNYEGQRPFPPRGIAWPARGATVTTSSANYTWTHSISPSGQAKRFKTASPIQWVVNHISVFDPMGDGTQ